MEVKIVSYWRTMRQQSRIRCKGWLSCPAQVAPAEIYAVFKDVVDRQAHLLDSNAKSLTYIVVVVVVVVVVIMVVVVLVVVAVVVG